MRILKTLLAAIVMVTVAFTSYAQLMPVGHFTKVTVSPYIQITFVQGQTEGVAINNIMVDSSKLHVEVEDGTLRMYLDGAKDIPGYREVYYNDGHKQRMPLYDNHTVTATVTYKTLEALSLRGEETQLCQSPLSAEKFTLDIYGESRVVFTEMHVKQLHTTLYGESVLEIRSGSAEEQYYTCYGEGKVNNSAVTGRTSKITAFGEAELNLNVTDRIKITAFGSAKLRYMGNPNIVKGLHFGDLDVRKVD